MSQVALYRGQAAEAVSVGADGATFTNIGPDIVYYGDQNVTVTAYEGSIGVNTSVSLTGSPYLIIAPSATRAYVNVAANPPSPDGSGVPAGGTTNQILKKNSSTAGDAGWADSAVLSNETPLSAGATAAAGSSNEASRADHVHPAAGFLPFPGGGTWISPWGQANASTTPVVGDLIAAPFAVPEACVITGLGLVIATEPSSDARVKLLLYSSVTGDAYWLPGAKVYESAVQGPLTGSTPLIVSGLNIPVTSGLYWFGYVFTVGTTLTGCVEIGAIPAMNQSFIVYGTDATPAMSIGNDSRIARQTGVTGTAPDPFAGALASNSNLPLTPPTGLLRIG